MATPTTFQRIIQINGGIPLTRTRSGDVIELDNNSGGSAQIALANAIGGQVVDFNVTPLTTGMLVSGSTSVYAIPFNTPNPSTAPSFVSATLTCTSTNLTTIFANVVSDSITTAGFSVALSSPVTESTITTTNHKLVWTAYA